MTICNACGQPVPDEEFDRHVREQHQTRQQDFEAAAQTGSDFDDYRFDDYRTE